MFIITIIIFIPITQQPEQDRWAENQPTAGLSSLNEYENEYENGMRRSETELLRLLYHCGTLGLWHLFYGKLPTWAQQSREQRFRGHSLNGWDNVDYIIISITINNADCGPPLKTVIMHYLFNVPSL